MCNARFPSFVADGPPTPLSPSTHPRLQWYSFSPSEGHGNHTSLHGTLNVSLKTASLRVTVWITQMSPTLTVHFFKGWNVDLISPFFGSTFSKATHTKTRLIVHLNGCSFSQGDIRYPDVHLLQSLQTHRWESSMDVFIYTRYHAVHEMVRTLLRSPWNTIAG